MSTTEKATASDEKKETIREDDALAMLPAVRELDSEQERTALLERIEERDARGMIDRLSHMEEAIAIFERRAQLLTACRVVAIRETNPQDWVLNKNDDGAVLATPCASGCDKIADIYGIQLRDLQPLDDRGVFKPDVETTPKGETLYRGWAQAMSLTTGRVVPIEAARSTGERFTGREDRETKEKNLSDMRLAVLTLIRSKAARIISGLSRVPEGVLSASWAGTKKSTNDCIKGHGFGTSRERKAQAVASADVKEKAEALWKDVLGRVGGDENSAKDLLAEITSFEKKEGGRFPGYREWKRITSDRMINMATRTLKEHETFGDRR